MRGKPDGVAVGAALERITPAGAGKTSRLNRKTNRERDHPRRCGENYTDCERRARHEGSPPQVRGKLVVLSYRDSVNGITPAGAGKTCNLFYRDSGLWDHPRRCGENCAEQHAVMKFEGSPPQVRGKRKIEGYARSIERITPAGAGKTCCSSSSQTPPQDHPRRCGENADTPTVPPKIGGSPPQVRGKLRKIANLRTQRRITPAGAGKTQAWSVSWAAAWGSPPQVRGKPGAA